jgi:transcriptional regulator with XRE-family HTH domain
MFLAANIRIQRAKLNLSQKELAQKAGVSQQLINALESGRTRTTKFLREIALALECTIADLEPNYGVMAPLPPSTQLEPGRFEELPIFAAEDSGDDDIIVSAEPVDYINRPAPLEHVRGAYGLIVSSDAMAPEFETGDIAIINPHLPPISNASCVFYSAEGGGSFARIKRLIQFTRQDWRVKLWNPTGAQTSGEIILPRAKWNKCHRIVGRYNRR